MTDASHNNEGFNTGHNVYFYYVGNHFTLISWQYVAILGPLWHITIINQQCMV